MPEGGRSATAAPDPAGPGTLAVPRTTFAVGLFHGKIARLFAKADPGWTLSVVGPRTDGAHPGYDFSLNPRKRQMQLFGG